MKKLLFLCDPDSQYDPDPALKAEIFADILDGLCEVTTADASECLSVNKLQQYHIVVIASENWDERASQDTIAALLSYTVSGGRLWIIGDAVRTKQIHEMHLLMGAKLIGDNAPCLLDFSVHKDHPITTYSKDFSFVEIPKYMEQDPFVDGEILIDLVYAQKRYPAMWCHSYGWGKVVCMTFGSIPTTYLPEIRKIVWRTAQWLLDRI